MYVCVYIYIYIYICIYTHTHTHIYIVCYNLLRSQGISWIVGCFFLKVGSLFQAHVAGIFHCLADVISTSRLLAGYHLRPVLSSQRLPAAPCHVSLSQHGGFHIGGQQRAVLCGVASPWWCDHRRTTFTFAISSWLQAAARPACTQEEGIMQAHNLLGIALVCYCHSYLSLFSFMIFMLTSITCPRYSAQPSDAKTV